MKKDKRITILAGLLIIVMFCAMLLMSQIIIEQNRDIISLKQRTHNLEVIVTYELGNIGKNFNQNKKEGHKIYYLFDEK